MIENPQFKRLMRKEVTVNSENPLNPGTSSPISPINPYLRKLSWHCCSSPSCSMNTLVERGAEVPIEHSKVGDGGKGVEKQASLPSMAVAGAAALHLATEKSILGMELFFHS